MIYVPILKSRMVEYKVAKDMSFCFCQQMIPLFEIIAENYETRYVIDEKTGEFIYEQHGKRRMKKKMPNTADAIITLEYINRLIQMKQVFIDYFRFSIEKYGSDVDISKAKLAYDMNNNYELYKNKIFDITKYANMIPVISIKKGFKIPKGELRTLIEELQTHANSVALRITDECIDEYQSLIVELLREEDYLLFDIEEQIAKSKFMELEEITESNIKAKKILLNSPRKKAVKNGEYPENDYTDLIDTSARFEVRDYGWEGFGDYCGLKDQMPRNGGSNGTGAALSLLYDFEKNMFRSFCNHDTNMGVGGYSSLIPVILENENNLNFDGDCPAYDEIKKLPKSGSWNTWHHINAVRYIYMMLRIM